MAYKKLIKVSNVCQLLDNSKYHATTTIGGITFTNNGNGTITIDGTAINNPVYMTFFQWVLNETHKYLFTATTQPCLWGQTYGITCTGGGEAGFDNGNGKIFTNEKILSLTAYVWGYNTVTNITFKPQLFDLTEMYRAGHEPTTVEQFRQDFPDEMYDYSPYCWLTSYKRVFMTGGGSYLTSYQRNLTCKTKNLFDISKVKVTKPYNIKVIGNSLYSYNYPDVSYDTSTLSIFKSLKPNTNYTMSAITNYLGDSSTSITLAFNNGDLLGVFGNYTSGFVQNTFSLTQEQIDSINAVYFYGKSESQGGPVIWSNIQIEEGDTATDYVPYGHL